MRWIIRLTAFTILITVEGLLINAWIAQTTVHYQHTFWGRRG